MQICILMGLPVAMEIRISDDAGHDPCTAQERDG
jgi:hypothetical protein